MSITKLLEKAIKQGAIIDERLSFIKTETAGFSAFVKPDTTGRPITIEISNSLIVKPEDAYECLGLGAENLKVDEVIAFKFYVACLLSKKVPNTKFQEYFELLPTATEIGSPLTMDEKSLYVFENTSLQSSFIQQRKKLLQNDFESISFLNKDITFDDFLWAHLIITSRAFPYRIVNPDAKSNVVMLLPIIDLLNHKPNTKVEWSSNSTGSFKFSNIDTTEGSSEAEMIEVFNNYGPKGNTELYLGYGFLLEDNEYETLQLSLSLPEQLKSGISKEWNVKLPTIDDYTYNVDSSNHTTNSDEENADNSNGNTVFMLNKFHPIAEGLLEVFCFINKNDGDAGFTLKNTMNGLNQLRQSLEQKYSNKLDKMPAFNSDLISNSDYENSKNLRKGQLKIYNLAKTEFKNREKSFLKQYRNHFITIKDIYKKDNGEFGEFINVMQWDKEVSQLNKMEMEILIRLWLLKTVNYHKIDDIDDFGLNIRWFLELFESRRSLTVKTEDVRDDEFMVDIYNQIVPTLKENVPELIRGDKWGLKDWLIIDKLIEENSYEKGKTLEPILIVPLNLV